MAHRSTGEGALRADETMDRNLQLLSWTEADLLQTLQPFWKGKRQYVHSSRADK